MMKNTFQSLFAACFFILVFSCGKDKNQLIENNGLVGKWKLTEIMLAGGPGPADFRKATEAESGTIEFWANGDFREIKGPIFSSINPSDQYKTLDSNKIELSVKSKQPAYSAIWYVAEVSPRNLTVLFDCAGLPCGGKYVAVK